VTLERLSLVLADTDALQPTFSGFSFSLDQESPWECRRAAGGTARKAERERMAECEGRVAFSLGHVAIFPFGKGRCTAMQRGRRRVAGDCRNVTLLVARAAGH